MLKKIQILLAIKSKFQKIKNESELLNRFLPTLLPLENPDLRAVATQRKVYEVKPGELLPYEVEYALARVLSK